MALIYYRPKCSYTWIEAACLFPLLCPFMPNTSSFAMLKVAAPKKVSVAMLSKMLLLDKMFTSQSSALGEYRPQSAQTCDLGGYIHADLIEKPFPG